MGLIAPYLYINAAMGIVGTIITVYTFLQRFLKDQLLVSEVMASLAIGVAIGPAGFNLLDPLGLGDEARFQTLIQVSKLVIAIQLVSAGLSLPLYYLQREWQSFVMLIGPVMVFTWIVSFAFSRLVLGHQLSVLQALMLAATLTPTDPILASSILQGKFAERHLPASLRNILAAESGANDGMALPLIGLPMLLLDDHYSNGEAVARWFWHIWCWEVFLAIAIGVAYGLAARLLMYIGNKYDLIDEPSHLAHIIGMALGTLGFAHIFGADGVLSVFVAAVVFSMHEPTAEDQRYDAMNGIELILTISYFIFFGTTLPVAAWSRIGVGRLILFSIPILTLRRLPVVVFFAPLIPEFGKRPGGKRAVYAQAAFAGFFGPIGVGAIFFSASLYERIKDEQTYHVVSFLVVASVIVHGILAAPFSMLLHHFLLGLATEEQMTAITLEEIVTQVSIRSIGALGGGAGHSIGALGSTGHSIGRSVGRGPEKEKRPTLSILNGWSKGSKDDKKNDEQRPDDDNEENEDGGSSSAGRRNGSLTRNRRLSSADSLLLDRDGQTRRTSSNNSLADKDKESPSRRGEEEIVIVVDQDETRPQSPPEYVPNGARSLSPKEYTPKGFRSDGL